jgi:DNA helicase-2/ATP-dependent DNA helicase PcrA
MEPDLDAVNILTVHRSKGLEFPVVFIVNLAANLFPCINRNSSLGFPNDLAKEELPDGDPHVAEERRLFYVAMTRAKNELNLTSARDYGGRRAYKISRFILEALELPKEQQKTWSASAWEQIKQHAINTDTSPASPKLPQPLAPTEPLTLSFYQIEDFLTCPLKYKYIHILKIPVLPHHAIIYGSALHAAVSEFYRRKISGSLMNDKEIIEIFLGAWVNEGFISREHEEMRQKAGMDALRRFVNNDRLTSIIPSNIEKSFSYTLGPNKIVGRIDRVDILPNNNAVIVDFKSSEVQNQEEADKKARESRQLKIYASAWLRTEGKLPERLELYFLESGLVGQAVSEPVMVEAIEELISKVADEIRQQDFPARHNAWACGYCPYRTLCPGSGK